MKKKDELAPVQTKKSIEELKKICEQFEVFRDSKELQNKLKLALWAQDYNVWIHAKKLKEHVMNHERPDISMKAIQELHKVLGAYEPEKREVKTLNINLTKEEAEELLKGLIK